MRENSQIPESETELRFPVPSGKASYNGQRNSATQGGIAQVKPLNVLIVDDDRTIREGCQEVARACGHATYVADSPAPAYEILAAHSIDLVILDMKLRGSSGLDVLHEVKRRKPDCIVVVITAYGTIESAVQAMRCGAYDYVTKPFNLQELNLLLERAAAHLTLTSENRLLREKVKANQGFGNIIGRSPEMEKLYRIISRVASSSHPVLILGESGTGKEMVARAIHFSGTHREKPFVPVDCGSLVPTLIESELFGHVKGAFTGASKAKDGLLAIAEGGTVFLDEIAELSVDLQSKLLRALQEREIRPVGGTKQISINVRIVAATNHHLEASIENGKFRRDLYYRLNVVNIKIPPLRERKQDIPLLVGHFLDGLARSTGFERSISDEALRLMLAYDWPGNVRELENSLERATALSSGPLLHGSDLPSQIHNFHSQGGQAEVRSEKVVSISEMERNAILSTIDQVHGDKLLAAKLLGIGKTTLYRKLKEYELGFDDPTEEQRIRIGTR